MLYDLHNPLDVQNARTRLDLLIRKQVVVELTEKKPRRTIPQNDYLHLLLGYFASQTGDTLEWVKKVYYKNVCNPDIFVAERADKLAGRVRYLRSSADLTTEEMTTTIERFRNWSATTAGIYLPDAENEAELLAAQIAVERHKTYLY